MEKCINLFNEINMKLQRKIVKTLATVTHTHCLLINKKNFEVGTKINFNRENKDRTILVLKERYRFIFCCF